MPQLRNDSIDIAFGFALFLAVLGAWVYLFARWRRQGVILPFEPRRPVPWGVWATGLAVLLVAGRVASATAAGVAPADDTSNLALDLALGVFTQLLFVGVFTVAVAVVSEATCGDLGLPTSGRQLARDVLIGIVACLAAFLPVTVVRVLVIDLLGEPEAHPMIQDVLKRPDALMLALAFFSAVVVAPVFEEIVFRLLLQGWLEKWEDRWRQMTNGECRMTNDEPVTNDAQSANEGFRMMDEGHELAAPSSFFLLPSSFFPRGALPIFASSTIFAWAHLGHSTDPFPIFVLALFLGFVYQRTHRIAPCIVAHALFNLISMLALWRVLTAA